MYKFKLNTYHLLPLLILVLALGLRSYRILDKDSLFMDENLSVVLSNYGTYGFSWPVVAANDEVKSHNGKELKNRMFDDDNSLNNVLYDLWNLRKSTRDSPHTNLYYSLLRISFLGADTADLTDVVRRGFLLNVLFFVIGFFFLYKLSKLLFRNSWILVGCVLVIMAINPISISNTIFLRSYQLQEMLFIALIYLLVWGVVRFKEGVGLLDSKKYPIGLILVTSLSLLAGYFGVPYVLMIWGGFVLYIMKEAKPKSRIRLGIQLIGIFVASIVLTFLIYPAYMDGFSGNRGAEATEKLSVLTIIGSLDKVVVDVSSVLGLEVLILFFGSLLATVVLMVVKRKDLSFESIATMYIVLCSIIWVLFAFYLAPIKEVRYISPITPIPQQQSRSSGK